MKADLVISCGELSGDVAIASFLEPIQKQLQAFSVTGAFGAHTEKLGFKSAFSLEGLSVMGFTGVLRAFWKIRQHRKKMHDLILSSSCQVVLFCDFPSFHLSLAKKLRQSGYKGKIIQYIAPSIWAWKKGRVAKMEAYFDEIWGILPFESPYYRSSSLHYRYCGNPSYQKALRSNKEALNHGYVPKRLGLFPGSRESEIKKHLNLLLEVAALVDNKLGPQSWSLSLTSSSFLDEAQKIANQKSLNLECNILSKSSPDERFKEMNNLEAAIAVSGTVCLELALHNVPTIAIYEMGWINYFIIKYLFKLNLKAYTLPNLMLGEKYFPEIMGAKLQAQDVAPSLISWLELPRESFSLNSHRGSMKEPMDHLKKLQEKMKEAESRREDKSALSDLLSWLSPSSLKKTLPPTL